MYLSFDDYQEYGGKIEDEERYSRMEFKARMILDLHTLGRITEAFAKTEAVKRCMFELVETYEQEYQQSAAGIGVSSVSNDGVSVSYGSAGNMSDAVGKTCTSIIRLYLGNQYAPDGSPLLFRGVG